MAIEHLSQTPGSNNLFAALFGADTAAIDSGLQFTATLESTLAAVAGSLEFTTRETAPQDPATLLLADDAAMDLSAATEPAALDANTAALQSVERPELAEVLNDARKPLAGAPPEPETLAEALPLADDANPVLLSDILHDADSRTPRLKESRKSGPFDQGIHHLINLVNEAAQFAPATPGRPPVQEIPDTGKTLPTDGRNLPQLPQGAAARANVSMNASAFLGARDMGFTAYGEAAHAASELALPALPQDAATVDVMLAPESIAAPGLQASPPPPSRTDNAALSATNATGDMPQLQSTEVMGSDEWLQELGASIEWLQDLKLQTAELQLHPAELGSLEIRIVAEDEGTTISFVTQTAAAREAIESTLPRLRDMLASQGLQLDQSSVSQQSAESHKRGQGSSGNDTQRQAGAELLDTDETRELNRRVGRALEGGRINHYV